MKIAKMKKLIFGLLGASLLLPAMAFGFHFSPQVIKVGTTFNGAMLDVTGDLAADEEVVVQVLGSAEEAHFKQKGRVGGILWMTVGHVTFKETPAAYFVYLPPEVSLWEEGSDPRWEALGLSYASLFPKIKILPVQEDNLKIFEDFLQLKQRDDLYQLVKKGVSYSGIEQGKKTFKCQIKVPSKIPLGDYTLRVLKIKDGRIKSVEQAQFRVEETGFPLFISKMAFEHSLIYGVLAVLIAIMAGLLMGLVFKDKGGAH